MQTITRNNKIAAISAAAMVLFITLLYLASRSSSHFKEEYRSYATLATAQEKAAYIPAAQDNDTRQRLNADLALALDRKTKDSARLNYAKDGLDLIDALNKQIDAIGDASEKADTVVAKMQIDSLKDFSTSGQTREIIDLAKQRSSIVEDIRGLSYRANFETQNIFKRIIADNGRLADSYVSELNNDLPVLETQFDHRSSLYQNLQSVSNEISQKAFAAHIGEAP
jgi:hypothetical protein